MCFWQFYVREFGLFLKQRRSAQTAPEGKEQSVHR